MAMASFDVPALLADASMKVAVLIIVAGGAAWALRRASAVARPLVWTLALSGALLIPALGPWIPRVPIRVPDPIGTETVGTIAQGPVAARLAPEAVVQPRDAALHADAGPDTAVRGLRTSEWRTVVAAV